MSAIKNYMEEVREDVAMFVTSADADTIYETYGLHPEMFDDVEELIDACFGIEMENKFK